MGHAEPKVLGFELLKTSDERNVRISESIEANYIKALSPTMVEAVLRPWTLYLILTTASVSQRTACNKPHAWAVLFASGSWIDCFTRYRPCCI